MPIPLDVRKKPTVVKVHLSTGEGVEVVWAEGHKSLYSFPYLRDHCPCAMCNDEREKKIAGVAKGDVFPMFKAKVTAKSASPVGNYAIQIEFSDGHASGIYSFDHLRQVCPCQACEREFRDSAGKARP
jgi:DUF971 family protein